MKQEKIRWLSTLSMVLLFGTISSMGEQKQPELWKTDFDRRSIDLSELISGGPPKDGIPALFDPLFITTQEAGTWLRSQEPVLSINVEGEARAYPLQILIWHEIVNDRIRGLPVTVTFCPLCYSAIAFDGRTKRGNLTFGVSGMLRHSDMVMYDHQTESFWQQLTGEAIVGTQTGTVLKQLPAQLISFGQFSAAYPLGRVLSRETGHQKPYGRNPYAGYDDISGRPFAFKGDLDDRLAPMEKVIIVSMNQIDKAYPHTLTYDNGVTHDHLGGQPIVIFHSEGAVSALDQSEIYTSREVGSTGVFDPRLDGRFLRFRYVDGVFVDEETGTVWDITGKAVDGKLIGKQLVPIRHGDFFAFAWLAFKPGTLIYR
jgi:hypothetical protein